MNLLTKTLIVLIVANSLSGYQRKSPQKVKNRLGLFKEDDLLNYVKCSETVLKERWEVLKCPAKKWAIDFSDNAAIASSSFTSHKTCCVHVHRHCEINTFFRKECEVKPGFDEFIQKETEEWVKGCTDNGKDISAESCKQFVHAMPEKCNKYRYSECIATPDPEPEPEPEPEEDKPIKIVIRPKDDDSEQKSKSSGNAVQRLGLSLSVVIALVSKFLLF